MRPRTIALVLFLGTTLFFVRSFGYGFYFDDRTQVLEGKLIREPSAVGKIFSSAVWTNVNERRGEEDTRLDTYRPLFNLSLWADYQKGGLSSWTFHSTNVALHAAIVTLLFCVLVAMGVPIGGAVFGAGLFALHPIAATPIHYVSARADSLAAFFSLLAVLAWIKNRAFAPAAYLAALLCKETALLLPLTWPLFRRPSSRKEWIGWAWGWVAALLSYAALRRAALGRAKAVEGADHLLRAVVNVPRAFGHFLRQTVDPSRAFPLVRFDAWSIDRATITLACACAIAAVFVAATLIRSKRAGILAGLSFSILTLSPPVVAMVNTGVIDGHYLYMPFAGLATAIVIALSPLSTERMRIPFMVLLLGLGAAAWFRAKAFSSEVPFYSAIVQTGRPAPTAVYNLGNAWMREGDWPRAREAYLAYAKLRPDDERWRNNLGLAEFYAGDLASAEAVFREAIAKDPVRAKTHFNLGLVLEARGKLRDARKAYDRALSLRPGYDDALRARSSLCARSSGLCSEKSTRR